MSFHLRLLYMDGLTFPILLHLLYREYDNYLDDLSAMDHQQYISKINFLFLCAFTKGPK